jgi:8-oxo-dGTP pyrophosphatase MutT (NUDIX family)
MTGSPNKAFISYSHADRRYLERLLNILSPVKTRFDIWSDERIQPGDQWREEIARALTGAKVAVLLVSSNFLASDFIARVELPALLKGAEARGSRILWVPVSDCLYEGTAIGSFQAVFDPKRPLDSLTPAKRQAALVSVARKITEALNFSANDENSANLLGLPAVPQPTATSTTVTLKSDDNVHAATASAGVEVSYRYDEETKGIDPLLEGAKDAKFIALTYRTLGLALTGDQGIRLLPSLGHVEIAVYALPILREWHPTLRSKPDHLSKEWKLGLTNVLTALVDLKRCPNLRRLDLRVINRVPTFTASVITSESQTQIRYTPVLEGEMPTRTPTINLTVEEPYKVPGNQIFNAYARIVDNMRVKLNPLTFPIARNDSMGRFVRQNIPELVRRLANVCNHPKYDPPDARFIVEFRINRELASDLKWGVNHLSAGEEVSPDAVYRCFDALRAAGRTDQFRVAIDFLQHRALIEVGKTREAEFFSAMIEGRHVIGAFALITKDGDPATVLLRHKLKVPWSYDVPGGKTAVIDKSAAEAITREMFEELGFVANEKQLSEAIAFKYDPHSRKEGVPVIALYCHYPLSSEECAYLDNFISPDVEAEDQDPLTFCEIEDLVGKKRRHRIERRVDVDDAEIECHAPLEAFETISRILHESRG